MATVTTTGARVAPGGTRGVTHAVLEAIHQRRSYSFLLPDAPPRETIETLLEAANRAPNHHLTQPWRFFVFQGDGRRRLGEAMEAASARRQEELAQAHLAASSATDQLAPAQPAKGRSWVQTFMRAPVVIAVAAVPVDDHTPFWEETAATAAATQNILLAAHALGLAAMWRSSGTGPEANEALDLPPGAQMLGYVYLGYPDPNGPPPKVKVRRPVAEFIQWRE
jgi:nitroreductase